METDQSRRLALASFLRDRRARLSPAAAGLDAQRSGRRRTPGLRREELASLAGVSVTWYTWLEQGRDIRVSRQVLTSLARALRLDRLETDHLFRLADENAPGAGRLCSLADIPAHYQAFLEVLGPLPAMITNQRFDVLLWNRSLTVLFPMFEDLPEASRNTLTMIFDPRVRALYADWHEHALDAVALFRTLNADRLVEPEYVELVDRLRAGSPEFRELWKRMDLVTTAPAVRAFNHPELGPIRLGHVKLGLGGVDAHLVVHHPMAADDSLRRLLAGPVTLQERTAPV